MTEPGHLDITLHCDPDSGFYEATCAQRPTLTMMDSSPEGAIIRLIVWLRMAAEDAS